MDAITLPIELQELLDAAETAMQAGQPRQALELHGRLLAALPEGTDEQALREQRLASLREVGRLYDMLNEKEEALLIYRQYYDEAPDDYHKVRSMVLIGNQHIYMGNYAQALPALQEADQLAAENEDIAGQARAKGGLGVLYYSWGRFEESLVYLTESLGLLEQTGDIVNLSRAHNRVGVARIMLRQIDKAIEAFRESSRLAADLPGATAMTSRIHALNNLGECYQDIGDMEQALVCHRQALELAEKVDPTFAVDMRRNVGRALLYLDRVEEAMAYLNQAVADSESFDDLSIRLQALNTLALAEVDKRNLVRGYEYACQLKALADKNRIRSGQANAHYILGLYHCKMNQGTIAEIMWHQALQLAQETGQQNLLWLTYSGLAQLANNPTAAAGHFQKAVDIIMNIAEPIEDESLRQQYLNSPDVRVVLEKARDTGVLV